jgi:hypothetical protein
MKKKFKKSRDLVEAELTRFKNMDDSTEGKSSAIRVLSNILTFMNSLKTKKDGREKSKV